MQREDLKFTHYQWEALNGDNPEKIHVPDSRLLDRDQGYEVLHLIKKIMKDLGKTDIIFGQKIEKKIHESPKNMIVTYDIINWVKSNL